MGLAGGDGCGAIFVKGGQPERVEGDLAAALIARVRQVAAEKKAAAKV